MPWRPNTKFGGSGVEIWMVGGMELSEMDIMVELVNHEDEEVPDDSVSYDDGFSIFVVGRRCSEC
jgi:hypothetical protein